MNLVVDASAVVAALTGVDAAAAVRARLAGAALLAAPHLIDPEVIDVLRRMSRGRPAGLDVAVAEFRAMPLARYPHAPLIPRIWALRANATSYDATYLALAESLGMPLLTLDARLARVAGHRAEVVVVAA